MRPLLDPQRDSPHSLVWQLAEHLSDGVALMARDTGEIVRENPAFGRLASLYGIQAQADGEPWRSLHERVLERSNPVELQWHVVAGDSGGAVRVGVCESVDEPDHLVLLMPAARAEPDIVTGLADRRVLEAELERRFHSGRAFALVFVDLDGFKQVNDDLGHQSGDRALREIAQRISATLRDVDLVGRYGGDEFVILLDGAVREEDLAPILVRVRDAAALPLESLPDGGGLSASVGWALSTHAYASPAAMLAAADAQMYANKRG